MVVEEELLAMTGPAATQRESKATTKQGKFMMRVREKGSENVIWDQNHAMCKCQLDIVGILDCAIHYRRYAFWITYRNYTGYKCTYNMIFTEIQDWG